MNAGHYRAVTEKPAYRAGRAGIFNFVRPHLFKPLLRWKATPPSAKGNDENARLFFLRRMLFLVRAASQGAGILLGTRARARLKLSFTSVQWHRMPTVSLDAGSSGGWLRVCLPLPPLPLLCARLFGTCLPELAPIRQEAQQAAVWYAYFSGDQAADGSITGQNLG